MADCKTFLAERMQICGVFSWKAVSEAATEDGGGMFHE